ncbi:hypothetical protein [Enterovibrio norvegicus]|uniref:hypothetical protein n=1 Tax=Enterovibrio norvegicus TaxID=188144 RepID=UPI000C8537FD|nr:hypothetical protein [Enterovibrio norvegicus]PML80003.1 hypothetical protein BCT69_02480 [Enterovibrio norvegicus]PMN65393.1 hypothetical protein BCT27_08195 [Enterovibrio norvegicus]
MKKLGIYSIAASAFFAASVSADPVSIAIQGNVDPICQVSGLGPVNYQAGILNSGATLSTSIPGLTVQCNYSSGANVTLTSTNEGMKSNSSTDVVHYTATLNMATLADLTLDTSASKSSVGAYSGSSLLATGETAALDIAVTGAATYAGDYSDTLTITIAQQ